MGQKANPISLRLRTTNKTFASCWYSGFYYPNLIAQELKTREYLSKLFAQIKYPNPCLSISFLPKRTKTLLIYLNPSQSRHRGCEKFQLRTVPEAGSFDPSIVFTLKKDGIAVSALASRRGGLLATPGHRGGGQRARCSAHAEQGHRGGDHRTPDICNTTCEQFLGEECKKSFVQKLLLLTVLHKVIRKELTCKKDHQFFQKLHYMTWFQGREENQPFLSSKELGISIPPRRPSEANEPHALLPISSLIGSSYKVAYPNEGLSFAERWSKGNEKEIEGVRWPGARWPPLAIEEGSQITKRESLMKLGRLFLQTGVVKNINLKRNESTSFLSYQLTIRKKDQIHLAYLESIISKALASPTTLHFYKSADETQAAHFMSDQIAYYLERRVPFRRIKQLLLRELKTSYIEGVRVICSGRVGGRSKKAQRARGERFQWGQTSSHVFSSKLSFSSRSALTPFGKVGIKVWICYK